MIEEKQSMQEIERKFLVTSNDFISQSTQIQSIVQGYINLDPDRAVRIRIQDDKGVITIKGKSNQSGTSRFEWEQTIPVEEAHKLLLLIEGNLIEKKRFLIPTKNHCFEVDVFEGTHQGLILAEIELNDENESFEKPAWLGKEVTGNATYYNVSLAKNQVLPDSPAASVDSFQ